MEEGVGLRHDGGSCAGLPVVCEAREREGVVVVGQKLYCSCQVRFSLARTLIFIFWSAGQLEGEEELDYDNLRRV